MTKHLLSIRIVPVLVTIVVLATVLVGCNTPSALRTTHNTQISGQGSVADGNTPPPGSDGAALCNPMISGPHQWPLNVTTKDNFYPNPSATPSATVKDVTVGGKTVKVVTITVTGSATPFPGQSP